jgi:hypothetical protein
MNQVNWSRSFFFYLLHRDIIWAEIPFLYNMFEFLKLNNSFGIVWEVLYRVLYLPDEPIYHELMYSHDHEFLSSLYVSSPKNKEN